MNTNVDKIKKIKFFSSNPAKAWTEQLFLVWGFIWVFVFGMIVVTGVYHHCGDFEYMLIGLFVSVPYVLLPLWMDPALHVYPSPNATSSFDRWCSSRYWVKSNVWVAIFSYVGNYFWTHYFYHVLGASYSFPVQIQLNGVPFFLYLITHAYFCFYHSLTNIAIRLFRQTSFYLQCESTAAKLVANTGIVFVLSVFTAFMETWTISSVPYYSHNDKFAMYTIGSVFYGIYFFASFPMFFRLDEPVQQRPRYWTLWETIVDALAACMIVTIFLDLSRLFICAFSPSLIANPAVCSNLPFLFH